MEERGRQSQRVRELRCSDTWGASTTNVLHNTATQYDFLACWASRERSGEQVSREYARAYQNSEGQAVHNRTRDNNSSILQTFDMYVRAVCRIHNGQPESLTLMKACTTWHASHVQSSQFQLENEPHNRQYIYIKHTLLNTGYHIGYTAYVAFIIGNPHHDGIVVVVVT